MPEIVLTEEQARILATSETTVLVRDPGGASVGALDPREAAIIAKYRRRLKENPQRRRLLYSCEAISAQLDALQVERDRIGRFSAEYATEFVKNLEASDPEKYGPRESP